MKEGYIIREHNPYGIYLSKESARKGLKIVYDIYNTMENSYKSRELKWLNEDCLYYTVKDTSGKVIFERMFQIEPVEFLDDSTENEQS